MLIKFPNDVHVANLMESSYDFMLQRLHDITRIWHKTIGISFFICYKICWKFTSGVVIISHCHVSLSLSYGTYAADKGTQKYATETTVKQANSVQIFLYKFCMFNPHIPRIKEWQPWKLYMHILFPPLSFPRSPH